MASLTDKGNQAPDPRENPPSKMTVEVAKREFKIQGIGESAVELSKPTHENPDLDEEGSGVPPEA